jgi:AcrR family transcriptional regulator
MRRPAVAPGRPVASGDRGAGRGMDSVARAAAPIIVAAAELFERRGYEETTVSAIAERSGYSRQTVYARYRSKESLLEAVVVEFFHLFPPYVLRWEAERLPGAKPEEGQPFPLSLLTGALGAFCVSWGPLARVALASRDLPWLSARAREACRELIQLLRYHLAVPGVREPWLCLCLDLLKQVALRPARGGIVDPTVADAFAALLGRAPAVASRPSEHPDGVVRLAGNAARASSSSGR